MYTQIVILSEHMLREHPEEFDDLVKGILQRGESSETSSEKSVGTKSGKGSSKKSSDKKQSYVCEICKKVFNNEPA